MSWIAARLRYFIGLFKTLRNGIEFGTVPGRLQRSSFFLVNLHLAVELWIYFY